MFVDKEMDKDVVQTGKYYSVIKRNGTRPPAATRMQLKMIILSEARKRKIHTPPTWRL